MSISRKKLGRNIRDARERNGLSQEALAERLGISWSQYSRIERGITDITISRLSAISSILNTSIEVLILKAMEEDAVNTTDSVLREQHKNTIISLLHGCSDNSLLLILELCKSVANYDKELSASKQK